MSDGKRLAELLELVFESQAAAGKALGASQPTINRLTRQYTLSDFIIEKYASALKNAGLNPKYIRDETAPMQIDLKAEVIEAIGLELEELKTRAAQVDAQLQTLQLKTR